MRNEVGGACSMGEDRKVYKILVAKPEGKSLRKREVWMGK
jgi:hypothetical protein